ncbi:hypothetical protein ACU4GA_30475 [Methylobacterium oryzae CBMB20]
MVTLPSRSNSTGTRELSRALDFASRPAFGSNISAPRQETAPRVSDARMNLPGCQSLKPIGGIRVQSRMMGSNFLSFFRPIPKIRAE